MQLCASPEAATGGVLKKKCFKNSAKLIRKHPCWSSFPALLFVIYGKIWLRLIHLPFAVK